MGLSIRHLKKLSKNAEYVDFLKSVTPDNQDEYLLQMRRFNLGPVGEADCPVFDNMFEYCAVRFPPSSAYLALRTLFFCDSEHAGHPVASSPR